jgi:hypothetical protein
VVHVATDALARYAAGGGLIVVASDDAPGVVIRLPDVALNDPRLAPSFLSVVAFARAPGADAMNYPLPSGGPCDCRFCRPGHALSRVAALLQDNPAASDDIAAISAALDAWYEESFEAQFDLDVIATMLNVPGGNIGVRRTQIVEHIRAMMTATPAAPQEEATP